MESTRVSISSKIVRWAFNITDTEQETQERLVKQSTWLETDNKHYLNPTVKQLGQFARTLHVPFSQMLLSSPPQQEDIRLAFRTTQNAPKDVSLTVRDVIYEMQRKQAWYKEESGLATQPLSFIGVAKSVDEETTLQILNSLLDVNHSSSTREFYNSFRTQLAKIGVLNMQKGGAGLGTNRPLSVDEVRAFVLLDEVAPLIFVNQKDSYTARVFSLIHEFVHLLRGSDELLSGNDHDVVEERIINHVVETFLMPEQKFTSMFNRSEIADVARYFGVSPKAAAIRAQRLGLIEDAAQLNFDYVPVPNRNDRGNSYNNALSYNDKRFMSALVSAQSQGELQPTKAASLIGISTKMLDRTIDIFNEREGLA